MNDSIVEALVDDAQSFRTAAAGIIKTTRSELVNGHDDSAPVLLWTLPAAIAADEWMAARLTPSCIVESLLYADVAALIAPGGTGKTTLILYMLVHIVLGRELFGRRVRRRGAVLLITAEDSREMLIARLREIAEAMGLTDAEITIVMRDIRISDVSGEGLKLTTIAGEAVVPSVVAETIISEAKAMAPVLIVIDPTVSFGIGEARVNDAEQGLIEAARRIRRELDCCVLYVHHTGKANARERALDQYAGRGGSAMADGARMVLVLQPMTSDEWREATGAGLRDGETGMVLALPKLSYCPPQSDILIARGGYRFTHTGRVTVDHGERLRANCAQVRQALEHEAAKGRHHSPRSLEALRLMPRTDLRDAVNTMLVRGDIEYVKALQKGGRQSYLRIVQAAPEDDGAPSFEATQDAPV